MLKNNNKGGKLDFIKWAKCFGNDHIVREAYRENQAITCDVWESTLLN